MKDRLWVWGAYSKNDINNFIAGPTIPQLTHITNWNAKLNLQLTPSNTGSGYYMCNNKTVHGRGLSITRPIETATDQSGPGHVLKFEDTKTFGQQLLHHRARRNHQERLHAPRRSAAGT